MQIEKRGNVLIIFPDPDEKEWFDKEYPDHFLKTSKHFKTKNFMDRFGTPTEDRYMEVRGLGKGIKIFDEKTEPVKDLHDEAEHKVSNA